MSGRVWAWIWGLGLASHALAAESTTIKANRVVVRAKPDRQSEALLQLNKGDPIELLPRSKSEEAADAKWQKIQLPGTGIVWVRKDLVQQNIVAKDEVYVRAGPSVNYSPLGKLKTGDKVEILKEQNDWLALKPLPGVAGWVAVEFVETKATLQAQQPAPTASATRGLSGLSAANNAAKAPPPTTPPPAEPRPQSAATPPTPTDKPALTLVTREGTLKEHTGIFQRPGTHELWNEKELKPHLLCYLDSSDQNLARYAGKRVQVSGEEHPVQGWDQPLLVVKQIKIME